MREEGLVEECEHGCDPTSNECKKPDLVVTKLIIQYPKSPVEGNEITFAFVIKNDGKSNADQLFWSLDTGAGSSKGNSRALTIGSGEEQLIFTKYKYSQAGTYTARVIADPDDRIEESNENNNEKALSFTVKAKTEKLSSLPGDVNCDSRLDLSDATSLLSYLFVGKKLKCKENADFNNDGRIDMADPIAILNYLF